MRLKASEICASQVLLEIFVIGLKRFQYIQLPRNELLMKVIIDGNKETVLPAIRQRMTEILRGRP
jgi:hypothetical protein